MSMCLARAYFTLLYSTHYSNVQHSSRVRACIYTSSRVAPCVALAVGLPTALQDTAPQDGRPDHLSAVPHELPERTKHVGLSAAVRPRSRLDVRVRVGVGDTRCDAGAVDALQRCDVGAASRAAALLAWRGSPADAVLAFKP